MSQPDRRPMEQRIADLEKQNRELKGAAKAWKFWGGCVWLICLFVVLNVIAVNAALILKIGDRRASSETSR